MVSIRFGVPPPKKARGMIRKPVDKYDFDGMLLPSVRKDLEGKNKPAEEEPDIEAEPGEPETESHPQTPNGVLGVDPVASKKENKIIMADENRADFEKPDLDLFDSIFNS